LSSCSSQIIAQNLTWMNSRIDHLSLRFSTVTCWWTSQHQELKLISWLSQSFRLFCEVPINMMSLMWSNMLWRWASELFCKSRMTFLQTRPLRLWWQKQENGMTHCNKLYLLSNHSEGS
jgi:hypothetical protein